jgi:hypothetical protein
MTKPVIMTEQVRDLSIEQIAELRSRACLPSRRSRYPEGIAPPSRGQDRYRARPPIRSAREAKPRRGRQGHRHGTVCRQRLHRHRRPAEAGEMGPGQAAPRRRNHPHRLGRRPIRLRQGEARGVRGRLQQLAAAGARTFHSGTHRRDRSTCLSPGAHRLGPASGRMNTAGRPNSARVGRVVLRHPVNAPPPTLED